MRPVDLAVRLEWIAVAVVALVLYALAGASWWLFALLILAPDLSMLGYLAGPRVGHELDRHAKPAGQRRRHVGRHARGVTRRGPAGDQEEIPHIDRGAQHPGRGKFGDDL